MKKSVIKAAVKEPNRYYQHQSFIRLVMETIQEMRMDDYRVAEARVSQLHREAEINERYDR